MLSVSLSAYLSLVMRQNIPLSSVTCVFTFSLHIKTKLGGLERWFSDKEHLQENPAPTQGLTISCNSSSMGTKQSMVHRHVCRQNTPISRK